MGRNVVTFSDVRKLSQQSIAAVDSLFQFSASVSNARTTRCKKRRVAKMALASFLKQRFCFVIAAKIESEIKGCL